MIRINLLKKVSATRRKSRRKPVSARVFVTLGILVFTAAAGIAGYYGYQWYRSSRPQKQNYLVETDYAPTSYKSKRVVEDVVSDGDDSRLVLQESGFINLPYQSLSFEEKLNYEFVYAKQVLDMLGRTMPPGIELETLEMDGYSTIRAVGRGSGRDAVTRTFEAMKRERIVIAPKPATRIAMLTGGAYRFTVSAETNFGLNLKDPLFDRTTVRLPLRNDLEGEVKRFAAAARESGVALAGALKQVGSEKTENYRRFAYTFSAVSSYKDLDRFVLSLYDRKIFCAFNTMRLKAQSPTRIAIQAEVVFTTR